jgi:hypothetical protein
MMTFQGGLTEVGVTDPTMSLQTQEDCTVVMVTHGLALRLFLMRWFQVCSCHVSLDIPSYVSNALRTLYGSP